MLQNPEGHEGAETQPACSSLLRVGLDLTGVISGNTGVAEYGRQHLAQLVRRSDVSVSAFAIGRGGARNPNLHHLRVPLRAIHWGWKWASLPRAEWITGKVDVVHATDMVPPPTRHPLVMTVHDALPLSIPKLYGPRFIRISQAARTAARQAAVVITDCHATADDLANHGYAAREAIVVASPGCREPLGVFEPVLDRPYLLAVGSVTPRKAFDILVEAVARLGSDAPLVVVAGPDGWNAEAVYRQIERRGLVERVRFMGRVDDPLLERLYRNASALCHPSLAEGFGIPCLEAMGLGVPVIAADIPSVREIGEGCIRLVPPGNSVAFSDAVESTLGDPATTANMVAAGRKRAEQFSWKRMTDSIVKAYRSAVQKSAGPGLQRS